MTTLPSSFDLPKIFYNAKEFSKDFLKIVLFDIWLVNVDRNALNTNSIIVEKNGYFKLYAIDHVQIFNGQHYLDLESGENLKLNQNDTLLELPVFKEIRTYLGDEFDSEIDEILSSFESINTSVLLGIFDELPQEWNLTAEESSRISEFIFTRQEIIKDQFYQII